MAGSWLARQRWRGLAGRDLPGSLRCVVTKNRRWARRFRESRVVELGVPCRHDAGDGCVLDAHAGAQACPPEARAGWQPAAGGSCACAPRRYFPMQKREEAVRMNQRPLASAGEACKGSPSSERARTRKAGPASRTVVTPASEVK